jgi:hypothetical protein
MSESPRGMMEGQPATTKKLASLRTRGLPDSIIAVLHTLLPCMPWQKECRPKIGTVSIQVDNSTRSPHLRDLNFEDHNVLRAGEGTGLPLSESSEVAGPLVVGRRVVVRRGTTAADRRK